MIYKKYVIVSLIQSINCMKIFDEPAALNSVAKFHHTFDLPVESEPKIPDPARCKLRINLLEEELEELKVAIEQGDIVEAADAFADLQYVLSGAILEFGLGDRFEAIFDEVQRSNMSKVCKNREEAEATLTHYRLAKGMEGEIMQKDDQYLVYRKSDRKVLKSVNYAEAKLEPIVNGLAVS
ncbi:MAG: nucleoside triphosphate pyrophosphohydrolase family protein [Saprospiraceae bacterium]|nr:nucleoside triphosphate pyrophosphohydrolase family protein [Saprospiraceae bacterium]